MKRILISAGEASSDVHAANLVRAFSKIYKKDFEFSGLGGENLISTGKFVPEFYNREFAVSGLLELGGRLPFIYSALRHFKRSADLGAYNAAVLLDYPDFNIPLAKYLSKKGIPVIYYISPQVWVWRSSRAYKLNDYSSDILSIFPFEKDFYAKMGIEVKYVGHPLLDEVDSYLERRDLSKLKKEFNIKEDQKIVAVLPGSRHGEIKYILPVLEEVCAIMKKELKEKVRFLLPVAPTLNKNDIVFSKAESLANIEVVEGARSYDVYSLSDCAILASGTATVEAGLLGVPMSIVYKVSPISAFLFKNFIRYKNPIGMINLLLGKGTATEFFQEQANPQEIAKDAMRFLNNKVEADKKIQELNKLRSILSTGKSASSNVADVLIKYL